MIRFSVIQNQNEKVKSKGSSRSRSKSKHSNKSDKKEENLLNKKTKRTFNEKFYNKKRKCLYDVLGDEKIRKSYEKRLDMHNIIENLDLENLKDLNLDDEYKKALENPNFKTIVKTLKLKEDDLKAIQDAREQMLKTKLRASYQTQESDLTSKMHDEVRERLKAQKI